MKSLLEQAKEQKEKARGTHTQINKETIDLALAWAKDEIQYTQVANVLLQSGSTSYATLALSLKEYIKSMK